MAERLSVTKKCCLNCKEFPTYGSVCSPFDVDQATFSCSGHLFDREDLLRRATAIEAENAELRAQLEAQRGELARELDLTKREAWTAKERHKDERDRADGLRERLDELSAEEFARAQRGWAVVVPAKMDDDDWEAIGFQQSTEGQLQRVWDRAASRIQPISADRVLADGMVGVAREEWEVTSALALRLANWYNGHEINRTIWPPELQRYRAIHALRSAKGGEGK